jgi:hypothetical protein
MYKLTNHNFHESLRTLIRDPNCIFKKNPICFKAQFRVWSWELMEPGWGRLRVWRKDWRLDPTFIPGAWIDKEIRDS